jgi:Transposase
LQFAIAIPDVLLAAFKTVDRVGVFGRDHVDLVNRRTAREHGIIDKRVQGQLLTIVAKRVLDRFAGHVHFGRAELHGEGFVKGLNNKIRVLQRRAYGIRDENYLRLKILPCTLPAL